MKQKILNAISHITRYLLVSFILVSGILWLFFILSTPNANGVIAFLYKWSIPLYYFFVLLLISLALLPFYFNKYLRFTVLLPKILFDIFLLADYFVFKIYRFHIDLLFIKMAIADFKGIGLSPLISFIAVLAVALIVAVNYYLFRKTEKIRFKSLKKLLIALLFFFLSGQVVHIWANYYQQQFIEQYTPYFPYYFPTTSHSLMKKWTKKAPYLIPAPVESAQEQLDLRTGQKDGLFVYPKKDLVFSDSLNNRPNILLIVLESWRSDMIKPEIMPHIDSLAQHVYRYNNHYSSGNVTVSGLFGLMMGLHPTYLSYAQADAYQHQSVLTKSLEQLGYDIKAYTSSNLDRFSLKAMLFGHIKDNHYINYMGETADRNDRKVIDRLTEELSASASGPWFKFVFLTSSHHHYYYPKTYEKFTPVPANNEGFIFDKNIDATPFLNDYKNALLYEDALVNEVLNRLKTTGQLKNTLIIITGDHAEEFNDNKAGYWGHGSNFTLYQTKVPLLIYDPLSQTHKQISLQTNHIDIVAGILKQYLGCNNPIADFSSGQNIMSDFSLINPNRGFIQTSYKDKAYLSDSIVYATGLRVQSYRIDNINKINKKYDYKLINRLRKEEVHFLKK